METRPSTYKPDYVQQARELCAEGLTDRELGAEFGVSRVTIWRWRAAHPDFAEATRLGKAIADERVERSLYERAVGFEEEAVRVHFPAGATEAVIVRYKREVKPDVTAALQWMRAREPAIWARPTPPTKEEGDHVERLRRAMARIGDRTLPIVRSALADYRE